IGLAEAEVDEDLLEHARQFALRLISTGLRSTGPAQAWPRGMDEHAAVADQVMAEQSAEGRVVPGLGQLIVKAQVDQADVSAFHQRPERDIQQRLGIEGLMQPTDYFTDFRFIEVDPRR